MKLPTADIIDTSIGPRLHVALYNDSSTELWFDCPVQLDRPSDGVLIIHSADTARRPEFVELPSSSIDALAVAIESLAPHKLHTRSRPSTLWK